MNCRQFLEKQITECEDIELKKAFLQSYTELLKLKSEFDKNYFIRQNEIHADVNKTFHTNNTNYNMAYTQQQHETYRHNYAQEANVFNNAMNHPQFPQFLPNGR